MLRLFRHYVPGTVLLLVAIDAAIVLGAVGVPGRLGAWTGQGSLWPKAKALVVVVLFGLYLADLYRLELDLGRRELTARLFLALVGSGVAIATVGFAVPELRWGRFAFVQIFATTATGLWLWRTLWLQISWNERLRMRVLVLGVNRAADTIVRGQTTGARRFTVVGFLSDEPDAHEALPPGCELLGKVRDVLTIVDEYQPDVVVVALREMRGAFPARDLLECRLRGVRVEDWPSFYEKQTGKILVTDMRPSWLIFSDGFVKTNLTQSVKRAGDIVLALVGLVLALPLMTVIALAIKLDSKGPVFFRQERVGQNGRIFVLNKFRSMYVDAESRSGAVWASQHDPRVTRVGRVLRKTRLDELPQLVNVLIGDMSFVGPRPERPEFVRTLQEQIPFYMERVSLRPGITGWAQVRHQYAGSVGESLEKLQYDLYYIKNLSPFLDLLILLHTIQVVLFGRGAR